MNSNIKPVRNLFTYKIPVIKLAVKELRTSKFHAILLVSVMLAGIFSLSPTIPSLMNEVTASLMNSIPPWNATVGINCTGRIATATKAPIAYRSEIRGVFIHEAIFAYTHDWDVIAETLAAYKIDCVYAHFMGTGMFRPHDEWINAINAFHAKGIKFHVVMSTLGQGGGDPALKMINAAGEIEPVYYCPIKSRQLIKENVEYVASTYDIDGFMLDYHRYPTDGLCYCPECRAAFETWLGETISDWSFFYPGGSRYNDFMEWRVVPVTDLTRDIRNWMLAIKPDLEFGVAAWTLFGTPPTYFPTYWRYWIGQDTADWVAKGYVDSCSPMMYTTDLGTLQNEFDADTKYFTGGPEGKVPLAAFITTGITEPVGSLAFKAVVEKLRELGADGWIIWRYGGPGVDSGGGLIDITPYLDAIDLPAAFTLENLNVASVSETEERISWTTDLPATSKVEYSTSPLFTATKKYLPETNFDYWDVDHVAGIVVEDSTTVTDHSITLTGLLPGTKYYFRVQSEDSSGIATSKVLTFTTG